MSWHDPVLSFCSSIAEQLSEDGDFLSLPQPPPPAEGSVGMTVTVSVDVSEFF